MLLVSTFMIKDSTKIIMRHASVKYFLHLDEMNIDINHQIENPVFIEAVTKKLEVMIINERDQQEKTVINELIKSFSQGNIDEAMKVSFNVNHL